MAVNRIRGAFTAPRKGETFELRAGLVYELPQIFERSEPLTLACSSQYAYERLRMPLPYPAL
jgi:hypothetical protein